MQNTFTLYPKSPSEAAADAPPRPVPITMMSSFLLLAGLTTLMSALCLLHFSANGPAGILESNFAIVFVLSYFLFFSRKRD
jgi:hypothetical protein